jgi:hypothetical protein
LIVYDPDENCSYQRIKIGDGTTKINDLNFTKAPGYVAQSEMPYDTSLLWLDTDDNTIDEDGIKQIAVLIKEDMLPAVYNLDGKILTDENGNVILRY